MRWLFGTAGIRGRYLEEVTPELAYKVGLALSTYIKKGRIVIGGDGRLTTPLLKLMAAAGAMSAGSEVIDTGLVPLPTLAWSIVRYGGKGGIYITASHNPPPDNGIKVFNEEGMEFLLRDEENIEEMIKYEKWVLADWDKVGKFEARGGVIEDYLNIITERLEPRAVKKVPKVLIDTANGAPSLVTPRLLKNLGADVISINSNVDGRFPGRTPEPRPDVLEPFTLVAKTLNVDVYFAQDGDGDRLAVVDPVKGFIKQDRIIALLAMYKLSESSGSVVVSIDCGNAVKDVVESMGGKLVIVKLGKTHEGLVNTPNAVMAAEPWKLIDPSWGKWVDGIYQAGFLTKLMAEEGVGIDKLMEMIPNYPQARYSIEVPKKIKDELFKHLTELLESKAPETAEILTIDGLRVNYEDRSWILIRKSGTEPKVRIYGEALSVPALNEMVNTLINEARKFMKDRDVHEFKIDGELIP
jgi:phosphomannomutase